MLADSGVLPKDTATHGLPAKPRDVESVLDPKKLLATALPRPLNPALAEQIGERISLDRLAQVPAYLNFRHDLENALKELNFL